MKFNKNDAGDFKKFVGEGVFTVKSATEKMKTNKNGLPETQIEMKIQVIQKAGDGFVFLTDWLSPSYAYKIKYFLAACGKQELFDLEEILPEMMVGLSGYCVVEDQASNPKYSCIKHYGRPQTESSSNELPNWDQA